MKKTRFSEAQIVAILKQQEAGQTVGQIIREHGISAAVELNRLFMLGNKSMAALALAKSCALNTSRKKTVASSRCIAAAHRADLSLENQAIKEVLRKK